MGDPPTTFCGRKEEGKAEGFFPFTPLSLPMLPGSTKFVQVMATTVPSSCWMYTVQATKGPGSTELSWELLLYHFLSLSWKLLTSFSSSNCCMLWIVACYFRLQKFTDSTPKRTQAQFPINVQFSMSWFFLYFYCISLAVGHPRNLIF